MSSPADLQTTLTAVLKEIAMLVDADGAECFLENEQQQLRLIAAYGTPAEFSTATHHAHHTAQDGLPKKVQQTGEAIYIAHLTADSGYLRWQLALAFGYHSLLCMPILHPNDHEQPGYGSFILYNRQERPYSPYEHRLIQTLSRQFALTIERARLLEAEREARTRTEVLQEVSNILNAQLDVDSLFDELLQHTGRVIPYDSARLSLVEDGQTRVVRAVGVATVKTQPTFDIHTTPTLMHISKTRQTLLIQDVQQDARWIFTPETAEIRAWMCAPIIVQGHIVAYLSVAKSTPYSYQASHVALLSALAGQVGLAVQNARLFEATLRQARQLSAINVMTADLTGLFLTQDIAQAVAQRLHLDFGYPKVEVYLANWSQTDLHLTHIIPPPAGEDAPLQTITLREGAVGEAAYTRQPQLFRSVLNSFAAAIPLLTGHKLWGVLVVYSTNPKRFPADEFDTLTTITDQISIALEKARLFEDTTRQAQELTTIFDISSAMRTVTSLKDILPTIVERCALVLNGTGGSVMLVEDDGDLTIRACYPPNSRPLGVRYPKGKGIVGFVAQNNEPYICEDVLNDPLTHIPQQDRPHISVAHSSISVPLRSQENVIGVLNVWYQEQHLFASDEVRLIMAVAEVAASALHRAMLLETLELRVAERTAELAQANEQLKELDLLKSRFVSEVTHELRTPIASLNLYLDLLQRNRKPEKQERYLEVLRQQAVRLNELVENILYLSRLDLGRGNITLTSVSLTEIVEQVLVAFSDRLEASNHTLTLQISPIPLIMGEPNQLAQLVTQLLDNALKYTANGQIVVRIEPLPFNQGVRLCVQDEGDGIDPEDMPHLFDRFYRGKKVSQSNIPGRGLGLAIVKEIVDVHHATVWAEKPASGGTIFVVEFPFPAA